MMFHKLLVSFVASLAAASSVAASVTPPQVPKDNGGYPPPQVQEIPASQCTTSGALLQCCDTQTSSRNPWAMICAGFWGLRPKVTSDHSIGLSCQDAVNGAPCSNTLLCCTDVSKAGTMGVNCTPVDPNQ